MEDKNSTFENVLDAVVSNGLCVGCGVCAGILPEVLRMHTNKYGAYIPELAEGEAEDWGRVSLRVCPFANNEDNEDTIAARLYGRQEGVKHRSETGYYLQCFTGHVSDEKARLESTSGGIITWLAGEMLSSGKVDAVACVGPSNDGENLFEFRLVRDKTELDTCRKSRYYPVEISRVIKEIKEADEEVLFIGLPCFLKAVRLAAMADSALADRIKYTIGLFCGHLKTKKYCDYLSRCCGVREGQASTVNFRKKVPDYPANKYAFEVSLGNNGSRNRKRIMMADVWANNWSYNLFMLDACEYCDDIVAETADVSVGDAWLPECIRDYRGTSMIVCRHRDMLNLLNGGAEKGELSLKEVSIDKVIQSQASGIRQRREGLQYRLYLSGKKGLWRPSKRVNADRKTLPLSYRLLQLLRIKTKTLSREAFLKQQPVDGIDVFVKLLKPWILLSRTLNFVRHIPGIICRRMIKLLKTVTS